MGNNDSTPKEPIPTVEESVVSPGSKPWVCKVDEHDWASVSYSVKCTGSDIVGLLGELLRVSAQNNAVCWLWSLRLPIRAHVHACDFNREGGFVRDVFEIWQGAAHK